MKMLQAILMAALALAGGAAGAAPYADTALTTDVTFFGSGILTGAPDGGGAFLSDTLDPPTAVGSITFGFSQPLYDGPGADFRFYEIASVRREVFDVALSADGDIFFSLGRFNALSSDIDVDGAYASPFSFVRFTNASQRVSADLDALEGLNFVSPQAVPLPAGMVLLMSSLGALGVASRRSRRA